jgi:hypothetical protein
LYTLIYKKGGLNDEKAKQVFLGGGRVPGPDWGLKTSVGGGSSRAGH